MTTGCSKQERLSLLEFKHTIYDDCNMLSSWVGKDCCRWAGVRCDGATPSHVVELHIKGNNTHSDIPLFPDPIPEECYISSYDFDSSLTQLRRLEYLKVLDLSGNEFDEIPESIGSLKQLTHLNLSNSGFYGIIPSHIGNLSNLKVLDLSGKEEELVAYDMAWVSGLSSLQRLVLNGVDLNGVTNRGMVLYMIPSLIELSLRGCGVSIADLGPHYNLSITLPKIEHLDLSNDAEPPSNFQQVNVPVPESLESLGKLTNLRVLRLSSNRLTGQIPEGLGRLRFLKELDLSSNQLSGSIPAFLGQLTLLDLSNNQLNGSIPESLGRLTTLTDLHLQSNRLTGPIPSTLGNLMSLQTFSVSSNLLDGVIPISIGQFTKLASLDVSNNSFEGVVSEAHFGNFSMLEYLDITYNSKLIFNVSRDWIPTFQLKTIRLGSCKIVQHNDEFPQWFRTQLKLEELVLSNANISGHLPTWLRNMPAIPVLDLSHNKITGPLTNLPMDDTYHKYGILLLQDNLFNGKIPISLCNRSNLLVLDLSKNRLTGKLPDCIGNLSLRVMLISSNELSGVIPSSFSYISPMWLKLNDNNFIGELPGGVWNSTFLRVLDVSNNEFSGNIPEWIEVNYLYILRLHKNNFTGSIPQRLCNSPELRILDVAHNSLTGSIPPCVGELTSMVDANQLGYYDPGYGVDLNVIQVMKGIDLEYTTTLEYVINMDLSSNKLIGEIPKELMTLRGLVGLNLSHNHLNGTIPDGIGNMKALNSLDFSSNELTGTIPSSIASLNFLSRFNLSYNNLSGRIPTGNQLQTLNDPTIYAGNRDLCGAPLSKNCSGHNDATIKTSGDKYIATNEPKKVWFYLDIMSGFATGFWGVIGVLLLNKKWRHKLFSFAEVVTDNIYVAVVVRVTMLKKRFTDPSN